MPGKGQKMIFHKKRYTCHIIIKLEHLPIGSRDTIMLMEPEEFYTLTDLADKIRLPYHTVRDIWKNSTKKKWFDNPLCPTVIINSL